MLCKNGLNKLGDIKVLSYRPKLKKTNEIKKIKKFQLFRNKTMDERDVDNYLKKLDRLYPIRLQKSSNFSLSYEPSELIYWYCDDTPDER